MRDLNEEEEGSVADSKFKAIITDRLFTFRNVQGDTRFKVSNA